MGEVIIDSGAGISVIGESYLKMLKDFKIEKSN